MREEILRVIRDSIISLLDWNETRILHLIYYLPGLPLNNLIPAPLCLNDLLVAVCRELGPVTLSDVLDCLDAYTLWKEEYVAPYGRGTYSYRLVNLGDEERVILRLGEHPNNGIMVVLDENDELFEMQLTSRIDGTPIGRKAIRPLKSTAVDLLADHLEARLKLALADTEENFFSTSSIGEEVYRKLPGWFKKKQAPAEFIDAVQRQVTAWSRRLLVVSYQSTLGDVYAYDLLRLPSGESFVIEWPDDGESKVIGQPVSPEPDAVFRLLVDWMMGDFDDGELATCDQVVLGTPLSLGQEYPVHSEEFWRQLLGYPYIFEGL